MFIIYIFCAFAAMKIHEIRSYSTKLKLHRSQLADMYYFGLLE